MRYWFALALSGICTMSIVAAQTPNQGAAPTPQPGQQQPTSSPNAPSTQANQANQANKVTYTGCLKAGTTADTWTLENAEIASAAGTSASGTAATGAGATASGGTGTSGAAGSKMVLGLTVKGTENLKPHTNHKIQVVGVVNPTATAATGSGVAASGATTTGPRQNLTVESFKMVSAACP
jgi:hypothetical protein